MERAVIQKKARAVEALVEKLKVTKTAVVFDYKGLNL